jgi:hypothetical protein
MRQVPHYLLIGNGRAAKHFRHYFSLLNLRHATWQRDQSEEILSQHITQATHILLLISDQNIEPFIHAYLHNTAAQLIHFSGSLNTPHAHGAHPLTTFGETLYSLNQYQKIPFIIERGALPFAQLLPELANPHFELDPKQKAKYHALCVAAGNFSCLLWQKLFSTFETVLGLPKEAAHLYLQQQTQNLLNHPEHALTGPLVRGDQQTIANNIEALKKDPLQKIYQSFVDYYHQINPSEKK